jgi:predicted nucleic acid-binding protein
LASITVAELLVGAEKADSVARRHRLAFVGTIVAAFPVLPLDVPVARLWAALEAVGGRIGPYDMVVAATALAHGYDVLTFNIREFARVPGLTVHRPDW